MKSVASKFTAWAFALTLAVSLSAALGAQVTATTTSKTATDSPSRWDIFIGYSYLAPKGQIPNTTDSEAGNHYGQINWGGIISAAYFFNKNIGIQVEGDEHSQSEDYPPGDNNASFNSNDDFGGGGAGVIFRYPTNLLTPFGHVLVGTERVGSIYQADVWGMAVTAGGGLDLQTPLFKRHLAWRIGQLDYQYIRADGGTVNAYRISTGVVYHVGNIAPPAPVTLACSANPSWVFPGDPITITATAGNLNPKWPAVYAWTGSGATGSGTTVTIATGTLTAGSYTVTGTIKEGKGDKPWLAATCTASFTVKAYEPPTVSCSADPSTIKPGDTSTITAAGVSPQNRPLTYSYSVAPGSGTISGSGTTATYNSAGAPTGAVGITCNVADDKGQTASANTTVTITAPYVAPALHTQTLCSISFDKKGQPPARVDNEAKACLDSVYTAYKGESHTPATVVVVGEESAAEKARLARHKHAVDLAAQRAVNTKAYLVSLGLDASSITVATGTTDGNTAENYLVPAGATFSTDVTGTTPVDETAVKPQARKPLGARHHAAKKEAAAAPAQ
ncbi:MAG: REJ domain-containing protein [Terracidiphilus sp.]|jgi:hypothetical protein